MDVVAGVIFHRGRILLAKRSRHKDRGGKWEFPGGKIEKDESAIEALQRELFEELQLQSDTQQMKFLGEVSQGEIQLKLYSLPLTGTYSPREHEALAWVSAFENFSSFPLCESDREALKSLEKAFKTLF